MGPARLIFLEGPQAGLHFTVTSGMITAGRSAQCDLVLDEKYASRNHFTIVQTSKGYIFENISNNPCRINGRKFKAGRQVILDTGDVLEIAADTKILFVAPDDDAQQAIDNAGGVKKPCDQKPQKTAVAPTPQPQATTEPQNQVKQKESKPVAPSQAKMKKYAVIFAIYLLMVAGIGVLLHIKFKDKKTVNDSNDSPVRLANEQIQSIVNEDFERIRNTHATRVALDEARKWHDSQLDPAHLYWCVYYYRLARAYSKNDLPAEVERKYRQARIDLINELEAKYQVAWTFEKARQFRQAEGQYNILLAMVPYIREYDDPIRAKILEHLSYIKTEQNKGKKRKR